MGISLRNRFSEMLEALYWWWFLIYLVLMFSESFSTLSSSTLTQMIPELFLFLSSLSHLAHRYLLTSGALLIPQSQVIPFSGVPWLQAEGLGSQEKDALGQISMSVVPDVASLHVHSVSMVMSLLPMSGTRLNWVGTGLLLLSPTVATVEVMIYSNQYNRKERTCLENCFQPPPMFPQPSHVAVYFLFPRLSSSSVTPQPPSHKPMSRAQIFLFIQITLNQSVSQCFYFIW